MKIGPWPRCQRREPAGHRSPRRRCSDYPDAGVHSANVWPIPEPTQAPFDPRQRNIRNRHLRFRSSPASQRQHREPFRDEQIQKVVGRPSIRADKREHGRKWSADFGDDPAFVWNTVELDSIASDRRRHADGISSGHAQRRLLGSAWS
jgi:hypothetical protein